VATPQFPPGQHAFYYISVAVAMMVLGIAKTGFGGGIGILAILIMALVMPAQQMLAEVAILLVVVDLIGNLHYLGEWDWSALKFLVPGAALGVVMGIFALLAMGHTTPARFDHNLSMTIGIVCLLVVAVQAYRLTGRELPMPSTGPVAGTAVGIVAGFVSTISHSAGPLIMLYLLQERIDKRRLVGTMLLYTLLINLMKLVSYMGIGTVTARTFREVLWMLPLLFLGTLAGVWMNRRIPQKPFIAILYIVAAAASVEMICRALA
jgi:uncharacterized membrane protein YfcA